MTTYPVPSLLTVDRFTLNDPVTPAPGAIKTAQMQGADEGPPEAYAAYAAGRARGGNEADGPFSSPRFKT
jgi:hypothetical protein